MRSRAGVGPGLPGGRGRAEGGALISIQAHLFLLLALCGGSRALHAGILISEVNYNPPGGAALEFIELHNTDQEAVSLAGWSFTAGIRYEFPEGAVIDGLGYLLVCQDRQEVLQAFALADTPLVLGEFSGSLDNGGERLTLSDATGAVVESFRYDDDAPWDKDADGAGPSLERVCDAFDAEHPANWNAEAGSSPSPLGPGKVVACPPPDLPPPTIAINEIYYHPVDDRDADEEFVELRNNTGATVSLRGYAFTAGIDFIFQEDTLLEPAGLLVVARNAEHARAAFGIDAVVGDFTGQLSNDGERLTLVDPRGALVDSVRYGDSGDWPVAADGLGRSLEKIVPTAISDDPASWQESGIGDLRDWRTATVSGLATSSRLLLTLDGAGEFLIDNVRLVDPAAPEVDHISNGTFDAGIEPWLGRGNHEELTWEPTGGPDASGAMRVVANGKGTGSTNGVSLDLVPELIRSQGPTYQLTFDYKYLSGATGLFVRVSGATTIRGLYWQLGKGTISSAGLPNTALRERLPPFISRLGRFPREPGSTDPVWITARVKAPEGAGPVTLSYQVNAAGDPVEVSMADDGAHGDGLPGDGTYGAQVPPQSHNTILVFRVRAQDSPGQLTISPPDTDPTGVHGYYVNDLRPETPLPNYTLLLNHLSPAAPRTLLRALNCTTYVAGSFAHQGDLYYNVGLRRRGQSVCGDGNVIKPYLKVRFQRGREFEGARKINLQSLWTDKALLREKLAWDMFDDVGMPYCTERHVRLHANGVYFGLYGELEHPDARFLARNRLNADGNLYKATASREEASGTYEKKTNQDGDMTDLREFLSAMHATPAPQLQAFFSERVDEDRMIDYQLAQTLTNNSDYPHKNHYLYHDTDRGRWMPLTWDMDLTYGKIWDGTYGGVLHDKMHNPGNTPWYTTSVDGSGGGNFLLDKFFSQAGTWYRRAYLVRLWDALQEKYTEAFFAEKIAALRDFLFAEQEEDFAAWGRSPATADDRTAPAEFDPNLERIQQHVQSRRAYLINYLKTRSKFEGHARLKITEVNYNPPGSSEDLEFLELWNPDPADIDISGWSIEGIGYVFPSGTTARSRELLIVAKDPAAFLASYGAVARVLGPYQGALSNDGEILRLKDAGPGYPATVDFLRYSNEGDWPRRADGIGYTLELTGVSPERDNDLPSAWRVSLERGGSPGFIEGIALPVPHFRRGDTDSDGGINVTDALVVVRYLYLGAGEPACLEASDLDGDGDVRLNDAVLLLGYLFQGSVLEVSPTPEECFPAPAGRCAVGNCSAVTP